VKLKSTSFFNDSLQAKNALDHLNGFHLQERYIVGEFFPLHFLLCSNPEFSVLYHMPARQDAAAAKADLARREEELQALKAKHNIKDDD
jgi:pre-mRNA branch site protein p14